MQQNKKFKIVKWCLLLYNTLIITLGFSYFFVYNVEFKYLMCSLFATGIGMNFSIGIFMLLKEDLE